MEKRVLLASVASFLFLALYVQTLNKRHPSRPATAPPAVLETAKPPTAPTAPEALDEPIIVLEAPQLRLEIGQESATVHHASLKKFPAPGTRQPVQMGTRFPVLGLRFSEQAPDIDLVQSSTQGAEFEVGDKDYHLSYSLEQGNSLLELELDNRIFREYGAQVVGTWHRSDLLTSNPIELIYYQVVNSKDRHKKLQGPWKTSQNVPRGTFSNNKIVSLAERYFTCTIESRVPLLAQPLFSSDTSLAVALSPETDQDEMVRLKIYIGPRDYFHLRDQGLEKAFPVGVFGRIGLVLLFVLGGIAGVVKNYGIAIIVFSVLISCLTAPFTLISLKSAKKMQSVAPLIEKARAAHKTDARKQQEELMKIYKEHKVSPFGGCFGMVLQIPILIALVQAMSHFIELRGRSFLWISDLSLPDRTAHLPLSLPFFGNELNVLPLFMSGAMFFQMRLSQRSMPKDQAQMAAIMSGPIMPIVFGLTLYHFPSGLILYWLTNTLTSMVWYRLAK